MSRTMNLRLLKCLPWLLFPSELPWKNESVPYLKCYGHLSSALKNVAFSIVLNIKSSSKVTYGVLISLDLFHKQSVKKALSGVVLVITCT